MNRVSSFSDIVNKIIRKRFKSYLFLSFAVILSVFFSSTLVLIAAGTYSSIIETRMTQYGRYDIILSNEYIDELIGMDVLSQYGTTQTIGYVMTDGKNMKNGFTLAKYDEDYIDVANKKLIEGSYPASAGEIAIEKAMLNRLKQEADIGDKITLTIAVPDGEKFLDNSFEKEYILTGVLEDQYIYYMCDRDPNPVYGDIPAALVSDYEEIEAGGMYITKQYGIFENTSKAWETLKKLNNDENSGFYRIYTDSNTVLFIGSHGVDYALMNPDSYELMTNAVLVSVLALVLILMSGFTIVSAFYSNVSTRTRQIGLLRVVGATKNQIKNILLQEIALISLLAIPVGILMSVLGLNILSQFFNETFILKINIFIIVIIVIFALVSILISAFIPLKRASQIPPMQIIRDSQLSQNLTRRRVRTKIIYNVSAHIAKRKTILYKNNLKPLTILIALTVIILAFTAGFGPAYAKIYCQNNFDYDFSIQIIDFFNFDKIISYGYHSPGISEADKIVILELTGDGVVYASRSVTANLECEINDYMLAVIGYHNMQNPDAHYHRRYEEYKGYFGFDNDFVTIDVISTDEILLEGLAPYVYEGQINIDKINSGEEVILFIPQECGVIYDGAAVRSIHRNIDENINYDAIYENNILHAGDSIDLTMLYTDESSSDLYMYDMNEMMITDFDKLKNTVQIGALVQIDSFADFPFVSFRSISAITSNYGFDKLGYYSPYRSIYSRLNYIPDNSEIEYIEQHMEEIASLTDNAMFTSYISINESNKRMVSNVIAVAITLFILFVVLSVCIISNSLSSSIHSSKVMIGTMRAAGANKSVITSIFANQLFYMIKNGAIIGTLIYIALYFATRAINQSLTDIKYFTVSIIAGTGYIVLLYLIGYLNIFIKTRKYLNCSIVENIKEL